MFLELHMHYREEAQSKLAPLRQAARLAHWNARIGLEPDPRGYQAAERALSRFWLEQLTPSAIEADTRINTPAKALGAHEWRAFVQRESVTVAQEQAWAELLAEEARVKARQGEQEQASLGAGTSLGDIETSASSDPSPIRRAEACALLVEVAHAYAHSGLGDLIRLRNHLARASGGDVPKSVERVN